MSDDALFQFGMGSVELASAQTEDIGMFRPARPSTTATVLSGRRHLLPVVIAHGSAPIRNRGNSAKALIGSA